MPKLTAQDFATAHRNGELCTKVPGLAAIDPHTLERLWQHMPVGNLPKSHVFAAGVALGRAMHPPIPACRAGLAAAFGALLDERDALREQLAETAGLEASCGNLGRLVDELRPKADRYDYLRGRDLHTIHAGGVFAGLTPNNIVLNGIDLDQAIDAALKENT